MTTTPTPGRLLALSGSYWQTCVLHAGVKLDLFTAIGREACTVQEVAKTIRTEERATAMLLNALVAMELLVKEDTRYRNSEESALFLDAASSAYQGYIIMHHHQLMASWARLDEAVKSGRPVRNRVAFEDETVRKHFLMGMFNIAMGLAPHVVRALDLSGRRKLLDLGGGPGTYALHFCQAHPDLHAVVFDLPGTRRFAEQTITRFGLADRVEFAAGDYHKDPLPGRFDTVWLSHILHAENPEACQRLIHKAVQALDRGGVLIVHDFILNDTMDGPLFPALFALNMLLGTDGGQAYAQGQVEIMLKEAGLKNIERLPLDAPNDSGLVVGTK